MTTKRTKICSCCGRYTEPQEQDWNLDIGYGHCKKCKRMIEADALKQHRRSVNLLCRNLSPANAKNLRSRPRYEQKYIINEAFKDGILSWRIGK